MKAPLPQPPQRTAALRAFLVELCARFGNEFIVIGDWAAYAYGATQAPLLAAAMISYEVQGTLRDAYELTKDQTAKKERLRVPAGDDLDLHVEPYHRLRVPLDEMQAYARQVEGMWVACPEHLLILMLDASRDRANTPPSPKDGQDLVGLLDRAASQFRSPELLARHLTPEDWSVLRQVSQNTEITDGLRQGDGRESRNLRLKLAQILGRLEGEQAPAPVAELTPEIDPATVVTHEPSASGAVERNGLLPRR